MTSRSVGLILIFFVVSVPLVGWAIEVGVAFTASHILGLVLLALATGTWFHSGPALPRDLPVLSIFAFLLVATLSVLLVQLEPDIRLSGESAHWKSVKQLIGLGFATALFMALYCLLRWYGLGLRVLRAHYWTTAAFAVLTILQYFLALWDMRSPIANFPVVNSTLGEVRALSLMYGFPRVSLTMVEPSYLATYLLSGWAFWLYVVDRPTFVSEGARRLFVWSGVVLGIGVIITGSRAAYVILGVLVLGALAVRPCRIRRAGLVGLSVLIGLVLVGPGYGQRLMATFLPKTLPPTADVLSPEEKAPHQAGSASIAETASRTVEAAAKNMEAAVRTHDISVQHRTASYLVAQQVLRERPILGTGFGTSGFYTERYWPSTFVPQPGATMLSHYATVATETGLLGLLCFTAFAIGVMGRLWRLARSGPDARVLAFGLSASVASYYIGAAGMALIVYQILLIWLLLALALTVGREPAVEA